MRFLGSLGLLSAPSRYPIRHLVVDLSSLFDNPWDILTHNEDDIHMARELRTYSRRMDRGLVGDIHGSMMDSHNADVYNWNHESHHSLYIPVVRMRLMGDMVVGAVNDRVDRVNKFPYMVHLVFGVVAAAGIVCHPHGRSF